MSGHESARSRGSNDDYLTSEQREFARLAQERADAEYAQHLASQDASGERAQPIPTGEQDDSGGGWWRGYGSVPVATAEYQRLPAGREPTPWQIPLMQTFFCCVSLRCGVLVIASCDAAAAVFQTLAAVVVLALPELSLEAEDETVFVSADQEARARRFLMREMRVRFFLSTMMAIFAFRGFRAVQSVDAQGLREYLNWKVLDTAVFAVMGIALHRLWWEGCGYLPIDSCWDLRYTYVTNTLMALLLPLYCIWAIWSLFHVLSNGDDEAFICAGFAPPVLANSGLALFVPQGR